MQLIWCLLSYFYLNMFRASLCPSSAEQECALPHMVFCTGCVHTARGPAPHNHSHHNQRRTPYAAAHTLVLLMMGIMMPETCWDKRFDNKRQISCVLLVSLSSSYVHDARSQEPKIWKWSSDFNSEQFLTHQDTVSSAIQILVICFG